MNHLYFMSVLNLIIFVHFFVSAGCQVTTVVGRDKARKGSSGNMVYMALDAKTDENFKIFGARPTYVRSQNSDLN